ncbi:hypothetical protein PAXRUDRAFT_826232 [Paxillus rubicundulus Ve08.2h10]|uniref:Uncharacterized protein n=1 Tax=Paxillus rubicundulus Ve08.2h10 TaxID=930991 RepID=A0A0D0DZS0_9AGAM|nr:hypothetical protein PAXRUDRAFT_826232 [Paxillus rubicundulus Ve08.2h10]
MLEHHDHAVLNQFYSYPFSSDEVFQQGLSGILAHTSMNEVLGTERSDLILKTQVFYFNRATGHNLNLEDLQAHYTADLDRSLPRGNQYTRASSETQHGEAPNLTFAELKSMIEQGKTDNIPNNKIIPDTLNDAAPTRSNAPVRKKPWEVASQS